MPLSPACAAASSTMTGSTSLAIIGRGAMKVSPAKPSADKPPALFARVTAALIARFARLSTALRHRGELEMLAACSDRELRDLAVTRNDIAFALSEPFWRDPAATLREARRPLFEAEYAGDCSSKRSAGERSQRGADGA